MQALIIKHGPQDNWSVKSQDKIFSLSSFVQMKCDNVQALYLCKFERKKH